MMIINLITRFISSRFRTASSKLISLLLLPLFFSCSNSEVINMQDVPMRGFLSNRPATSWEEALVTGNGTMGAMIMGLPYSDTIIVNHALLYMPLHEPRIPIAQGDHLDTIRSMMLNGDYGKASQFVVNLTREDGWKTKLWTDPFIPAFNLVIDMDSTAKDSVSEYARTVNFATGEAKIKWMDNEGTFSRSTFVSRKDNLIITKIISNGSPINCKVALQKRHDVSWWGYIDRRTGTGMEPEEITASGNTISYKCDFTNSWEGLISGYEGFTSIFTKKGEINSDGTAIEVKDAREVLIITFVNPTYEDSASVLTDKIREVEKLSMNYPHLLKKHSEIHGGIFNRTKLDIGGNPEEKKLPVEILLAKEMETPNPSLVEMEFDAARYNIISATGVNPPNLQGIWSGVLTPPWSADFTMNGNVPVAVASMLSANMPELMLPLFDLLERNIDNFRVNAKKLYNCRGIHVASRMSSHGYNNHFDAIWTMSFWTGGAGWYSMFYYDYYLYTGDINFLKNRAVPFMEESMAFYEDFLTLGKDGKYVFNPSYSPENNPANIPFQACINATMDVMIAKQLIRNLINASKILEINQDKITTWSAMLERMPAYELTPNGELREWIWPGVEENFDHRHVSQLYALYDIMDPEFNERPELMKGAIALINEKMKYRRRDKGGEMAFGMVQLAYAAAMIGDSEACYDILGWLSKSFWFNNMVTTHNPHSLFNLDLSGGYPAVIIKMLAYSEPGLITLFPALPKEMPVGTIDGVLLRGNIEMKTLHWDQENIIVEFISGSSQDVTVRFPNAIDTVKVNGAEESKGDEPSSLILKLQQNKPAKLEIKLEEPCFVRQIQTSN